MRSYESLGPAPLLSTMRPKISVIVVLSALIACVFAQSILCVYPRPRCVTVMHDTTNSIEGLGCSLLEPCKLSVQLRIEACSLSMSTAILQAEWADEIYQSVSTTHNTRLVCAQDGTGTHVTVSLRFSDLPTIEIELVYAEPPEEVCEALFDYTPVMTTMITGPITALLDASVDVGACPDARCFAVPFELEQISQFAPTYECGGRCDITLDLVYDAESGAPDRMDMQLEKSGDWFRADHLNADVSDSTTLVQICSTETNAAYDMALSEQDASQSVLLLRRLGLPDATLGTDNVCRYRERALSLGSGLELSVLDTSNGASASASLSDVGLVEYERVCTDEEYQAVADRRAQIQSATVEQMDFSGSLLCYHNEDVTVSAPNQADQTVNWTLQVRWPSTVELAQFDEFPDQGAQLSCASAFGLTTFQVNNAAIENPTADWALTWSFQDISCAELLGAYDGQSPIPMPISETVSVFYDGVQFSYDAPSPVSINNYLVQCPLAPSASPSVSAMPSIAPPSPSASPMQVPSASPSPQASASPVPSQPPVVQTSGLQIIPFVSEFSCDLTAQWAGKGMCNASFGYFNPNSINVSIPCGSEENALFVRGEAQCPPGCPSVFLPGNHSNVFDITFDPFWRDHPGYPAWAIVSNVDLYIAENDEACTKNCRSVERGWSFRCAWHWIAASTGENNQSMRCANTKCCSKFDQFGLDTTGCNQLC